MTSPLTEREGLILPTIEKIMVDLFKDDELFAPYQGAELQNIFQEFFYTYNINQSTLRQYTNKSNWKSPILCRKQKGK